MAFSTNCDAFNRTSLLPSFVKVEGNETEDSGRAAQVGTKNVFTELNVSKEEQAAAKAALDKNTTYGSQFKEKYNFQGNTFVKGLKWMAAIIFSIVPIYLGYAAVSAKVDQNSSNAAKELLRNPTDLRETVKELGNRNLTSFEDTAVKGNSVLWPAQLTHNIPKKEMDTVDAAATEQAKLGREWMDALKKAGTGMDDNAYKALVAEATTRVQNGLAQGATTNYMVEGGVAAWHETQAEFVGNGLVAGVAAAKTPADVAKLAQAVEESGESVARIMQTDNKDEIDAIYGALNRHGSLQEAIGARKQQAIHEIGQLRDISKLRTDYLRDNLRRLEDLSGGGLKGEEWLKLLLTADSEPAVKKAVIEMVKRLTPQNFSYGSKEAKAQLQEEMQRASHFLTNLENGFAAYVTQQEEAAQEQLALIAALDDLGNHQEDKRDSRQVDAGLQGARKIPAAINLSGEENAVDAIDAGTLVQIAQILLGDGSEQKPGSPTLFKHFMIKLKESGRLDELKLGADNNRLSGVLKKETHASISEHFSCFTQNKTGPGASDAVTGLREHFAILQQRLTSERQQREVREAELQQIGSHKFSLGMGKGALGSSSSAPSSRYPSLHGSTTFNFDEVDCL